MRFQASVDFVNFQGGVDCKVGIAKGGAGRGGRMARGGRETGARTLDCVGIAVAFGVGDGKGVGGDEFVERSALAVGGDVDAFGLGDLQEIGSNTGQADGLRRSRTVIRGGHPLQREFIDYKEKGCTDQKANKRAHKRIVAWPAAYFKWGARRVALGNNLSIFALICVSSTT